MIEDDPYLPIPCDLHGRYERAAMRRAMVVLEWQDDAGVQRRGRAKVVDLLTRQGEELLVLEPAGGPRTQVRLDRIRRCDFDPV